MSELLQTIEPWADLWAASLWRASWQGAVVLAVTWGIARWCTFLSPRIVCWIWRLACIKLLVALFWIQPVALALLPAKPVAAIVLPTVSSSAPASEPTLAESPAGSDARLVSPTTPATSRIVLWNLLLPLWLMGVFYRITVTARQWSSVRRLCRLAGSVSSGALQRACRQEADRLAVRRLPRLRLSPQADGPLLAGIWRPTIVLPDGVDAAFDGAEIRLMLGHELAHLKRRDLLWNWLPTVVGWLFFFHPLVWLMTRRWSEAQEAACDELLIQNQVARPAEYGRLLLKLSAHWPLEPRATLVAAGVLGAYRNLERRILGMAHVRPISRASLTAAACIAIGIGTVAIVPWQLTAQEIKNEEDQKLLALWDKMTDEQAVVATSNNVAAIMAAVHNYSDAHEGTFPPIAVPNPNVAEVRQLSGLVLLLPYLGERPSYVSEKDWAQQPNPNGFGVDADTMRLTKELYRKIDLTKAWDDPENQEAARSVIPVFLAPKSAPIRDKRGFAVSHFAFIRGYGGNDNGAFDKVGVGLHEITDGTSLTLAVGQIHSDLGPWLAAGPSTARYAYPPEGSQGNSTFGSQFEQGWFAALADASTWFVDTERAKGKGKWLQPIVQRNDRTPVQVEDYAYRVRPESELKKLMSFLKREK